MKLRPKVHFRLGRRSKRFARNRQRSHFESKKIKKLIEGRIVVIRWDLGIQQLLGAIYIPKPLF
jgi:hypothetical protein